MNKIASEIADSVLVKLAKKSFLDTQDPDYLALGGASGAAGGAIGGYLHHKSNLDPVFREFKTLFNPDELKSIKRLANPARNKAILSGALKGTGLGLGGVALYQYLTNRNEPGSTEE